jgi:molecular chaperone GrpE (heat shock protein)
LRSVQKFVTGLLDAVDDLERALESVPADAEQQKKDPINLLHGLRDGIVLTQKSLEKVREQDRSDLVICCIL